VKNVSGYAVTATILICWECSRKWTIDPCGGRAWPELSAVHCVERWSLAKRIHADPGVVGTTVRLYNDPFTVIGVAPARFNGHGAI